MTKVRFILYLFTMTFGLVGLCGNAAKAAFVDLGNGFNFNDTDLILSDGKNNKEWLNLTLTVNRSYADISDKLDANEEFAGWQYASSAQLGDLLSSWTNIPTSIHTTQFYSDDDSIDGLIPYLGNTQQSFLTSTVGSVLDQTPTLVNMTKGFLSDLYLEGAFDQVYAAFIIDYSEETPADRVKTDRANLKWTTTLLTHIEPGLGSFLIRDVSVVPLPPSAILFGTALLGLAGLRRRKRKAA